MSWVTVTGLQWGDEGKGKVVDQLARDAEVVARFQGGHNAGHTLVIDGEEYRLSLVPSGAMRRGTTSVVGSGAAVDPWAFLAEVEALRGRGLEISPKSLIVSEGCTLILPLHRELDGWREEAAGVSGLGTTRRGIGPSYEDRVGRRALRAGDLLDLGSLRGKMDRLAAHHDALRRGLGKEPVDWGSLEGSLREVSERIGGYVGDVSAVLEEATLLGRNVLCEGAQGAMLDVAHGTYPYVTSSHTTATAAGMGLGVGLEAPGYVLGVVKAYATRVGEGPFPTELKGAIGERLAKMGSERGTVTDRPRRCGWFDGVLARRAVELNGVRGLALTKLDVLDGFEEIRVCVGYRIGGEETSRAPFQLGDVDVEPIYETLEGWEGGVKGARRVEDLPSAARAYVRRLEELMGTKAAMISTGAEREEVISLESPFTERTAR